MSVKSWLAGVAVAVLALLGLAAGLLAWSAGGASARVLAPAAFDLAAGPGIPQPGTGGTQLRGVRCVTRTDCWAVGFYVSHAVSHNEALHWDGRSWSLVSTPSPGTVANSLESVSCTSASNCWAAGTIETSPSGVLTALNEALHWDGHMWSLVPTPDPGGTAPGDDNELQAITCASPASCWAVGDVSQNFAVPTNEALHWDGHAWSQVSTPTPGEFSLLSGARCLSAADCWAVGFEGSPGQINDEALHWDGHTWSLVPTPSHRPSTVAGGLSGVRCTSPANCWAVGSRGIGTRLLQEALHWDGRTWSRVSVPNPGRTSPSVRNALQAVSCTSATSCWAVGSDQASSDANSAISNEALHWDGRSWSRVSTPNPAGTAQSAANNLNSVACITSSNCWAVGSDNTSVGVHNLRNQILHWNGTNWSAAS